MNSRLYLRQSSPRRSPLSHRSFHLPSHLSLFTVVHSLSVQPLTKCSSRNSFVFKTIHFDGGYAPPLRPLDVRTCRRSDAFPIYPLSFHILPHSFAPNKNSTRLFSNVSALFAKNHPGWGVPPCELRTDPQDRPKPRGSHSRIPMKDPCAAV